MEEKQAHFGDMLDVESNPRLFVWIRRENGPFRKVSQSVVTRQLVKDQLTDAPR